MIIGHFNLIRLVLLALLLSIAVRQILPAEGIRRLHRPPPASTGLHSPPHDSTNPQVYKRDACPQPILFRATCSERSAGPPGDRPSVSQKKKSEAKLVSAPRWKAFTFHFALAPLIRYSSSVVRHLSTVTKHVPCSGASIVHRMACFPPRYHFFFQSSLARSCYPSVRFFGFFGVLCVCVFACLHVSVFARESHPLQLNKLTTWGVDTPQPSLIDLLSFAIRISYRISLSYYHILLLPNILIIAYSWHAKNVPPPPPLPSKRIKHDVIGQFILLRRWGTLFWRLPLIPTKYMATFNVMGQGLAALLYFMAI